MVVALAVVLVVLDGIVAFHVVVEAFVAVLVVLDDISTFLVVVGAFVDLLVVLGAIVVLTIMGKDSLEEALCMAIVAIGSSALT